MNETVPAPEQAYLTWETRIKVLANPSIWLSLLMAFGIPSVLLGILIGVIAKNPVYALLIPLVGTGGFLLIFVLVGLVIDLFGGFKVIFALTTHGVRSMSGKVAKATSAAAVLTGIMTGNLGAMGAGLLAESEQNVFIPWGAVTKVKVAAGRRVLTVKREWGFKPIALYCTRENYAQVLEIFRYFAGDKLR